MSIRRRALDLVYALVNETNVKMLVRELLNFLLISDIEFKPDLTAKLCLVRTFTDSVTVVQVYAVSVSAMRVVVPSLSCVC